MKSKDDRHLYNEYKREIKREKKTILFWQLFILISFITIWEIASRFNWIDPLLFSSPTKIIQLLTDKITDGSMITHIQITLFETVLGFIIGTVFGIMIASALWSSTRFSKIMHHYLVIMNAMPKVALGPILIVALGPGYVSIITMGAMVSVIITTLVVYAAFQGRSEERRVGKADKCRSC